MTYSVRKWLRFLHCYLDYQDIALPMAKMQSSKPLRNKVGEYISAGFDDFTKRTIYRLSMEKLLHFSQQLNNIM